MMKLDFFFLNKEKLEKKKYDHLDKNTINF